MKASVIVAALAVVLLLVPPVLQRTFLTFAHEHASPVFGGSR
jgi:hypothetical protein